MRMKNKYTFTSLGNRSRSYKTTDPQIILQTALLKIN